MVITLCAKVLTSMTCVRPYRAAMATLMLSTPTASGRPVATSAPNTTSSSAPISGKATSSLRLVSLSAKWVKSSAMACPPVTRMSSAALSVRAV